MEWENQREAICEASRQGDASSVAHLLDKYQGRGRRQALTMAAQYGKAKVICILLSRGTLPSMPDFDGSSPLHYAVEGGHTEAVIELLKGAADPEMLDSRGVTPLKEAAARGFWNLEELMRASMRPWTPASSKVHMARTRAVADQICRVAYMVQKRYSLPYCVWCEHIWPFLCIQPGATTA